MRCRFFSLLLLQLAVVLFAATTAVAADPAPGKQVEQTLKVKDGGSMGYLLYLPKDYDGKKPLPLMLFLHGRGESFGPLSLVKKWGPPRMVERGESFPFILVSPQCPRDDSWSRPTQQARLVELLDVVHKKYRVDKDRVYLTGLSMGGYGSWRLAADHPQRFAAVAPVCGGGSVADAKVLKQLPIWVFHGDQDRAVPFSRSVKMVKAIQDEGGMAIRFTTFENIGHNCWSATYATPELYSWMLKQTISARDK